MADNIDVTAGSGKTIAADEISSVLHQRVKIEHGADGSATDVSTASPLPVTLANTGANSTAVKTDGSAVTQPVSIASVPSHAVTNAGTFATQATEADGANTTLGAKADAKSSATDSTAITAMSVLKQISASVQAPPSQAVTNAGTFATQAAQSGTWTVQPGNTANTTAWKVDGSAVTQPISASALPLPALAATSTKQSDGTQKTQIVDGSGNVIGATSNALDINIKSGNPTTTAVTQATAASLNATVVGTGTFVTQSTLAAETTKVIGVTRMADGSGNLVTSTGNALDINIKTGNPTTITATQGTGSNLHTVVDSGTVTTVSTLTNQSQEGGVAISLNAGAVDTGTRRVVQANGAGKTIVSAGGSVASSGNNTLVSAGTNKLKVFAFSLSTTSTTAVTCIFQSGASGTELWRVVLQAGTSTSTGANLAISPPAWLFATASATLLNLNLSGAQTIHWSASYFDEA